MKGWGVLLVLLGLGSFVLPALGMQFRLIQAFGGDPSATAAMFIIVGVVVYSIGSALERRSHRRALAQRAQAAPPAATRPADPSPAPVVPSPAAQAASGVNFCGNCGTRLTKAGKFCTSCGAPL
jgi:hypothetical protein